MSTCTEHRSDVFGQTDMRKVAREILDLRYDTLAELMDHLETEAMKDSAKDKHLGHKLVSEVLYSLSFCFATAYKRSSKLYEICKKYM